MTQNVRTQKLAYNITNENLYLPEETGSKI